MSKTPRKHFDAFRKFHKDNPHVYDEFSLLAFNLISQGYERGSAYDVFEDLRWQFKQRIETDDDFKLNNNHRPYYARLWEQRNPEWRGFLEMRRSAADSFFPMLDDDAEEMLS